MMHFPLSAFTPVAFATAGERTVFHSDGSRTVTGTLGTIRYDADGTATFIGGRPPIEGDDTPRWDLAA